MFGKDHKKKELVNNLADIYGRIEREHQISPGDFPNLKRMQVGSAAAGGCPACKPRLTTEPGPAWVGSCAGNRRRPVMLCVQGEVQPVASVRWGLGPNSRGAKFLIRATTGLRPWIRTVLLRGPCLRDSVYHGPQWSMWGPVIFRTH